MFFVHSMYNSEYFINTFNTFHVKLKNLNTFIEIGFKNTKTTTKILIIREAKTLKRDYLGMAKNS